MRRWLLYAQGDDLNEGWSCRPALAGPQAGFVAKTPLSQTGYLSGYFWPGPDFSGRL
jgi:hypothetical protein